jgi:hypothetical protein
MGDTYADDWEANGHRTYIEALSVFFAFHDWLLRLRGVVTSL